MTSLLNRPIKDKSTIFIKANDFKNMGIDASWKIKMHWWDLTWIIWSAKLKNGYQTYYYLTNLRASIIGIRFPSTKATTKQSAAPTAITSCLSLSAASFVSLLPII